MRVDVADGRTGAAVAQTVATAAVRSTRRRRARVQADRPVRRPDPHGRRHVRRRRWRQAEHRVAAGQTAGRHPTQAFARRPQTQTLRRRRRPRHVDVQTAPQRVVAVPVRQRPHSAGRPAQPVPGHDAAQSHHATNATRPGRVGRLLENARRPVHALWRPSQPVHRVVQDGRGRDHLLRQPAQPGCAGRDVHAQVPAVSVVLVAAAIGLTGGQKEKQEVREKGPRHSLRGRGQRLNDIFFFYFSLFFVVFI